MLQVNKTVSIFIVALGLMLSVSAIATQKSKSQKVIDFEDEVVEGVNKQPLDSLSQINDRNKRRHKPHLYFKRGGFRSEIAETLRVTHYTP